MAISLNSPSSIFAAMRALTMTRLLQANNAAQQAAAAGKAQAAAEAVTRAREHTLDIKV